MRSQNRARDGNALLRRLGVSFDDWGEIRPPIAKEKAYTARREKGEICGRNRLTCFVHFRPVRDVRGPPA
jgi:hypothetical protein